MDKIKLPDDFVMFGQIGIKDISWYCNTCKMPVNGLIDYVSHCDSSHEVIEIKHIQPKKKKRK